MTPQAVPISNPTPHQAALAAAETKRQRADFRKDALYVTGATLVAIGAGMVRPWLAFIAAGFFCLLFPMLELATGFIRGLRANTRIALPPRR